MTGPDDSKHKMKMDPNDSGAVAEESVARLFEVNGSLSGLFCGYVDLFCGYVGLFCRYVCLFCGYMCRGLLRMRVWHTFLRRMCLYEGSFADV